MAASGGPHLFIAVVPQADGSGNAPREARARLARMLDRLSEAGLLSSGMIGDPDPYTAAINALELFRVDDVVISTLPGERSGWLRSNLIERVRGATSARVEHVVVDTRLPQHGLGGIGAHDGGSQHPPPRRARRTHPCGAGEHHGPPPANRSSRVEPAAARHAAFHHLGDHGLRGLLHGLLLHPHRQRRPLARPRHDAAGRRSRRSTLRSSSPPHSRSTGPSRRSRKATISA